MVIAGLLGEQAHPFHALRCVFEVVTALFSRKEKVATGSERSQALPGP
jgi:hypothetical protein